MEAGKTIKIAVVGAAGRMGQEVLRSMTKEEGIEVVVAIDHGHVGTHVRELVGPGGPDLVIEDKLGSALDRVPVDVLVDFSHHSGALQHALQAIKRKASPLIGVTGLPEVELREIKQECQNAGVPGMYVPNFAIGAVLMMHFAELAARWLPDVEVIEMHHDQKEDAPSGTAILTADRIAVARSRIPRAKQTTFKVEGVRGGVHHDVHLHSVRLPGLVAHQIVIFGGVGETLTIRHDSLDRKSFMEGVKLCVKQIGSQEGFVVGMEKLLFAR